MNNYYTQAAYSSKKQVVNGKLVEAKDLHYINDNGQQQLSSRFLDDDGNIKQINIEHPLFERLSSNKKSLKKRLMEDFKIKLPKTLKKGTKKKKSSPKKKSSQRKMSSFKKSLSYAKGITKRLKKFKRPKKTKVCRTKKGRYTKCRK